METQDEKEEKHRDPDMAYLSIQRLDRRSQQGQLVTKQSGAGEGERASGRNKLLKQ